MRFTFWVLLVVLFAGCGGQNTIAIGHDLAGNNQGPKPPQDVLKAQGVIEELRMGDSTVKRVWPLKLADGSWVISILFDSHSSALPFLQRFKARTGLPNYILIPPNVAIGLWLSEESPWKIGPIKDPVEKYLTAVVTHEDCVKAAALLQQGQPKAKGIVVLPGTEVLKVGCYVQVRFEDQDYFDFLSWQNPYSARKELFHIDVERAGSPIMGSVQIRPIGAITP